MAGYGDVAERRVIAALVDAGQEVAAVWGRRPERAREFAARHGIGRVALDVNDLCRDVDAVYVALPVSSHIPVALQAAERGRHVLIEKPLSGGLHQIEPLILELGHHARCGGVAYYRRTLPSVTRLARRLREGELGAVRRVVVDFACPFDPGPEHPKFWRTVKLFAGAGVLADEGSHRIDLLCYLLGRPTLESARLSNRFPGGSERVALIGLRWPAGTTADLVFEWTHGPRRDRIRIETERGVVELDPMEGAPANSHSKLIEDFAEAAAAGRSPACPIKEAAWTDAVIRQADTSD